MKRRLTIDETMQMSKRANKWVSSKKGRVAVALALRQAEETVEHIRKSSAVSHEMLHTPMDI